jgi:hypothetical protein
MAEYDLEALSLGELKKMQKDVAKAISTFEDRQKAEARAKVEALARDLGYSWPNSSAPRRKPLVRLSLRNTGTLRTQRSPGPAGGANRSGSWRRWLLGKRQPIWQSADLAQMRPPLGR